MLRDRQRWSVFITPSQEGGGLVWVGEGKAVKGVGGYSSLPVIIFKRLYPQSVSIMVGPVWT